MAADNSQSEPTIRKGRDMRKDAELGAVADPQIAYDIQGAADKVSLSYTELKRAMDAGELEAKLRGTKPLILRESLEKFANSLPSFIPKRYR
ncbi:hypothetical protein [Prescottella equi]|uniref:hypothetical protein n=1 Tax=Rhodococcus hoagii TaxID=43767 RepID=UPI001EEA5F5E|nr:hypothetical protein [Prescottella equi]